MRSSPMPVSIDGRGRSTRVSGSCCSYCMKTRFHISMKRSPSSSGLPGGPPGMPSPWSKNISEHGPHGPVSPIDQKLSLVGMRMMRSSGRPAIFFHRAKASSSSENTVTSRRSAGRPNSFVTRFQASSIATSLK